MRLTIKNIVLMAVFTLACIAASLCFFISTAHADSISVYGNTGGYGSGSGYGYGVRFRATTNGGDVRTLESHYPGFKCENGVMWEAYRTDTGAPLFSLGPAYRAHTSSPGLAGNWDGGIGGGRGEWGPYVRDAAAHGHTIDLNWIAGCLMLPQNRWGSYTYNTAMYNLASKTDVDNSSSSNLETCSTMYDNFEIGTDGYPLGLSYSKENTPNVGALSDDGNTVTTPYGQLYNTLLKGAYSQISGSAGEAAAIREKLMAAAMQSCTQTATMKTGITVPKDSAISQALAKGGIASVVKQNKSQTIEYPTTSGQWYYRPVTRVTRVVHFCGSASSWSDGRGTHACNHNGIVSNSEQTIAWNDMGSWTNDSRSQNATNGYAGRRFTGSFYCYRGATDMSQSTTQANYMNGCYGNVASQVRVHYTLNSWVQMYHYDILNILCDKQDFLAYKQIVGNAGFSGVTDNSVTTGNNSFQGSLVSNISYDDAGTFPRMAQTLAAAGRLNGYDTTKVLTDVYASYSPADDPIYTRECPFACTSSKSGGQASSNGASSNANTTNARNASQSGVVANPSDGKGGYSANATNGSNMEFFRDNNWNKITTDLWYPQNGNGVTYDGSRAKTTIVTSDANGTPKGNVGATLQTSDGTTVFSPTASVAGAIATQTSPVSAVSGYYGNSGVAYTTVLDGQHNTFRIKAPWASDTGSPLRYNVKWEYNVNNAARVFTGTSSTGDTGAVSLDTDTTPATSDGKCDALFNGSSISESDIATVYNNSGAGTTDSYDSRVDLAKQFTVLFVRTTSD